MDDIASINSGNIGETSPIASEDGIVNPGTIDGQNDGGNTGQSAKRGRGRPRRIADNTSAAPKQSASKKANYALDTGTITFIVAFAGNFISESLKQPSLNINLDEASTIAQAAANVARHYDMPISPVTQAWIGLAGCLGTIYGPKIMAIKRGNN